MDDDMTPREHTILLVSDDAALRATARRELETIDERRHVSSVSTVDAARRIVVDAAPAVILLTEAAVGPEASVLQPRAERLDAAVSSLATYAPVVVIGDAEHQTEFSGLVAAGAADYVVLWSGGCARPRAKPKPRPLWRNRWMPRGKMGGLTWSARISARFCATN
jgi:hypothetical protein